jgi:hypothetical protein
MFLEIEIGILAAGLAAAWALPHIRLPWAIGPIQPKTSVKDAKPASIAIATPEPPASDPNAAVQLLKRVGAEWIHLGHRHYTHPDVREALETPGLAVRFADGRIDEGIQ